MPPQWPHKPTFDLQVPDVRIPRSWMVRAARYDCWCVDVEGMVARPRPQQQRAIAQGADDCFAPATYIQRWAASVHSWSTASRPAPCVLPYLRNAIPSCHPARSRRHGVDWPSSPTLHERRKKLAAFSASKPAAIDRPSSIRSSIAITPVRPTDGDRCLRRRRRRLDTLSSTGTMSTCAAHLRWSIPRRSARQP